MCSTFHTQLHILYAMALIVELVTDLCTDMQNNFKHCGQPSTMKDVQYVYHLADALLS
jgi:hypothetical protein